MYAAIASITTSKLVGKYRLSNFEHVRIQVFSHPADNAPEGQLAQERPICDFFECAAFGMLNDFQINAALPICALPISSGDEYQQRRRIGASLSFVWNGTFELHGIFSLLNYPRLLCGDLVLTSR